MFQSTGRILLAFATLALFATAPARSELNEAQSKDVEAIIEKYILDNPDLIERALIILDERRKEEEKLRQSEAIAALGDTLFNSEHQVVLGNPDGEIALVEFFDYNCGYCRRAMGDMLALMASNPDLKIVLKEFPILSEGSMEAARVGIALNMMAPERYLDFHQEMFNRPGMANRAKAEAIARDLGIDSRRLGELTDSPDVDVNIGEVRSLAVALGLNGTPAYVLGNESISGAVGFERLQERIVAAREQCETMTC